MGRIIVYRAHGESLTRLNIDADTLDEATLKTAHGIYTVFRVYPGRQVLRFAQHSRRMHRSAELLGQIYQVDDQWLRDMTREAVTQAEVLGVIAPRMRITVPFDDPKCALFAIEPFTPPSEDVYQSGVAVGLVTGQRESPLAKNSRFIERRQQMTANQGQAYEVILADEVGNILEGVGSNFYGVLNGELRTADKGVLPGIARGVLLDVAADILPINLTPINRADIPALSEAMLTSASRGVVPIVRIGDQVVGDGMPGQVARTLRDRYDALVDRELEPL